MRKYLLIWAIVMVVLYLFTSGIKYPDAGKNVLGIAVISLIVILKFLSSHWKGEVIEVKTEEKYYSDDDGGGETVEINYAYIKLDSGKTKKIKNKGWKVGDKLEKKRGQSQPQLVS